MLLQLIPLGYTDNNTKDKWLLKSISKSQQQLTCLIQPINSAANKTTSLYRNVYGLRKKIWYPTGNCLLECQKIIVKDIKYMYRFPNRKIIYLWFYIKVITKNLRMTGVEIVPVSVCWVVAVNAQESNYHLILWDQVPATSEQTLFTLQKKSIITILGGALKSQYLLLHMLNTGFIFFSQCIRLIQCMKTYKHLMQGWEFFCEMGIGML